MKRTLAVAAALAFAIAACGDDGPTGPGGNDNDMAATVGGVPFEALAPTANFVQGVFEIGGSQTVGVNTTLITINVVGAEEGQTYQLNPNFAGTLGLVSVSNGQVGGTSTWTTALSPGTGSITFSTLNADRAIGTFQFTGQAGPGTAATGQKAVTSGTFDIEL